MLTLVFNIKNIKSDDSKYIESLQHGWSVAFRKVYSNIELMQDDEFKNEIINKYIFSKKAYEYLCKEVESFYDKFETSKNNKHKSISEIQDKLKNGNLTRKQTKVYQRKLSNLLKQLNNNVVFGSRVNLEKITKYSKLFQETNDEKYKILLNKYKQTYQENRILPMTFYGETSRCGNRFFDLSNLSEEKVVFKYETLKRKVELDFFVNKGYGEVLLSLQQMAVNKAIPITIKLTKDKLYITYEEGKLTGKHFDTKEFYKTIKHIKNKEDRMVLISNAYREHEKRNFKDKKENRYCGIDLNPKGIGYSVIDKLSDDVSGDFQIIKKGYVCFDLLSNKKVSSDKRKHELSIAIKKLFKEIEHLRVSHFVTEDLSNIHKLSSNRETNRQVKNIWNRNYLDNLITKWCNHYGIKRIDINPVYSSFIGNILYNEYDPVASSIEINRRGIIKYIKGNEFLPSIHKGVITEIAKVIEMDYNELENISSWKEAWGFVSTAKKSVRRVDLKKFNFQENLQNKTEKSKVKHLCFQ